MEWDDDDNKALEIIGLLVANDLITHLQGKSLLFKA